MQHDTRTGDVRRVVVDKLPQTRGPATAAAADAGTYTLVCHATSTNVRADLYCIRLNTITGDMLVIDLAQVGALPDGP